MEEENVDFGLGNLQKLYGGTGRVSWHRLVLAGTGGVLFHAFSAHTRVRT